MKELNFNLPLGYSVNGVYTRAIKLLKGNAVSEEVFTKKLAERPNTWIGNVISVATKSIGDVPVGEAVRADYLKTGSVVIPLVVKQMPLADANTMLLEIHRRVWKAVMPKQQIVCKFCAKSLMINVDLDKVVLDEFNLAKLEGDPEFNAIEVNLPTGLNMTMWLTENKKTDELSDLMGVTFNKLIFRVPTLGDAIKNEAHASKSVDFWRRIALDCLVGIQQVSEDGKVLKEFPTEKFAWLGLKLFNHFDSDDLQAIREELRDELPVMPFAYYDLCPCDFQREIPVTIEASGFFSE